MRHAIGKCVASVQSINRFEVQSPLICIDGDSNAKCMIAGNMNKDLMKTCARLDDLLTRAQADSSDVDLFAHLAMKEECPICHLPIPHRINEVFHLSCCGKEMCGGCRFEIESEITMGKLEDECALCRQPHSGHSIHGIQQRMQKRTPYAYEYLVLGDAYKRGCGVPQSDKEALQMFIRSAELGNATAFAVISTYYSEGLLVKKNLSRSIEFLGISVKLGSVEAREVLALIEAGNGNSNKAVRHWTVAAGAGSQESLDHLKEKFKDALVSKDHLTQALYAFHAYNQEKKSESRNEYRDRGSPYF